MLFDLDAADTPGDDRQQADNEHDANDLPPLLKKIQAPTPKTTWIIIYIILGFLAVVSLLFFARWFGRGRGEAGRRRSQVFASTS